MKVRVNAILVGMILYTAAQAAPRQLIDLGQPGWLGSRGAAINDSGQVAGECVNDSTYLWRSYVVMDGITTQLTPAGSIEHTANGINSSGQVSGWSRTPSGTRGYMYSGGQLTNLPGGAVGINDLGQLAGSVDVGGRSHACIFENGTVRDLGALGVNQDSQAMAINNLGQVAGYSYVDSRYWHAVLWSGGKMTDLGTLGGMVSMACAMNDRGDVAGYSYIAGSSTTHAFLYSNGSMLDLGVTGGRYTASIAYGTNNSGQVVGRIQGNGVDDHAFLWDNGVMVDLNTLLAPEYSGYTLREAYDINNNGWITGYAISPYDHREHAFVLTPEPATMVLLAFGAAAVRRRLR
jgi:probable HAF family extracellular repeat protein